MRVGVSVTTLEAANCISNPALLEAGQVIFLPPGSIAGTPTANPTDALPDTCFNPAARITAPVSGMQLSGQFTIEGTASIPNFQFYKLEIRAESASNFITFFLTHTAVPTVGVLGTLDSHAFAPGLYRIQLVVVDNTGNYPIPPCVIRVRFG
jgi:hypothetical protein